VTAVLKKPGSMTHTFTPNGNMLILERKESPNP
jgi:hypothetical protein